MDYADVGCRSLKLILSHGSPTQTRKKRHSRITINSISPSFSRTCIDLCIHRVVALRIVFMCVCTKTSSRSPEAPRWANGGGCPNRAPEACLWAYIHYVPGIWIKLFKPCARRVGLCLLSIVYLVYCSAPWVWEQIVMCGTAIQTARQAFNSRHIIIRDEKIQSTR